VRGYRIIERISRELQLTIAKIVDLMSRTIKSSSDIDEKYVFIFLTQSETILKIFVGIFQQLLINLLDEFDGFYQIDTGQCIFQYGNIVVTVGDNRDLGSIISTNTAMIFHLCEENIDEFQHQIKKEAQVRIAVKHLLIFDAKFIETEFGKEVLSESMNKLPISSILDVSTPNRLAEVIHHIISNFLQTKID
jgi:hypothetical protein